MSRNFFLQPPQFAELPATFYSSVNPEPLNRPYWVAFNPRLAEALGLDEDFQTASNLAYLSGSAERYRPQPLATVYSGHQFGAYTPRLGDGRALLLGDSEDKHGRRWEWQLKGAGKTPYSRFADGRAVLRSSIREYLCSEAMHGLGIPTTRALALCGSQDPVYRERQETAAVLTRIAPSFIRFGHFEYLFYQGREAELKLLADFLIRHHYPDCRAAANPYAELLHQIGLRTASLAAAWQSVGFCHGVLNTDNMSALGLTIDYGPFGFMDAYATMSAIIPTARAATPTMPSPISRTGIFPHWPTALKALCPKSLSIKRSNSGPMFFRRPICTKCAENSVCNMPKAAMMP